MMTSVSGERGIGKTYHLAKKVYEHYQAGFLCITNFTHVYSHIDCSQGKPETLIDIIREIGEFKKEGYELCDLLPTFKHTGVFIAIDEAHLIFGADRFKRYQSDPDFQFIIQFLAQARKQDVNIWYSTQDPSKIDINWRRYTEDWIRYKAVIPLKRRVLVPHPSRPTLRREIRYIIPLIWEEYHHLDSTSPHFNYSRTTQDGISSWSQASTLDKRRIVLSGWLDPFPYKLYDSHQMIGLDYETISDYKYLKSVAYIPHTMKREKFPWMKGILGLTPNDEKMPTRYRIRNIELPPLEEAGNMNIIKQTEDFLDDLSFFNKRGKRKSIIAPIIRKKTKKNKSTKRKNKNKRTGKNKPSKQRTKRKKSKTRKLFGFLYT